MIHDTAQKIKFSIKDFFSKCDQIRRKLRIWSHLPKKSLMENFIFCAVRIVEILQTQDYKKSLKFIKVRSSTQLADSKNNHLQYILVNCKKNQLNCQKKSCKKITKQCALVISVLQVCLIFSRFVNLSTNLVLKIDSIDLKNLSQLHSKKVRG